MRISIIISAIVILFPLLASSNDVELEYENHSMILIETPSAEVIKNLIQEHYDIVEVLEDGSIRIVAGRKDESKLLAKYGAIVEIPSIEEFYRKSLNPNKDMGGYLTYDETYFELYVLSLVYPDIVKLDTIGYSIEGNPIYCLKISNNVHVDEDEPKILFNGIMHAREAIGLEICVGFAQYITNLYFVDEDITNMINSSEIYLIPILNPDGYLYNELTNPGGGGMWRKNRRDNGDGTFGVDLNRNWGFLWGFDDIGSSPETYHWSYRGTAPFSEPEIEAIRQLIISKEFSVVVNYHSYGNMYMKPWGFNRTIPNPDTKLFNNMLDTLHALTGYDITQSLYTTNGSSYAWQYGEQFEKKKALSFLPEIGSSFWPPASAIDSLVNLSMEPNLFFIREGINYWNRTSRYIATDFIYFDTLVNNCDSYQIGVEIPISNYSNTLSMNLEISIIDSISDYEWLTSTSNGTQEIINPYETIVIPAIISPQKMDFDFDTTVLSYSFIQVVSSWQGVSGDLDTLRFPISMSNVIEVVEINPDFTVSSTNSNIGEVINFTNISTTFDACLWDFGDGSFSMVTNPSHSYDWGGHFTIKLFCYSSCYVDSVTYENLISIMCCNQPGDANNDGSVGISDLTFFVDYLFANGAVPECYEEFDNDADCFLGISDLTYFVGFMFGSTEPPSNCHLCNK